ncbi:unnamed protein product [Heligmosomoides polygyrus]|uniref:ACT domain-containing protein n=1 Tax=Heligmosomoides polygyrus TaxID=6339 RepID=A0A183G1E1_HELPZ|nr:unnamed protein product [Heligmosomoides polygyrus]
MPLPTSHLSHRATTSRPPSMLPAYLSSISVQHYSFNSEKHHRLRVQFVCSSDSPKELEALEAEVASVIRQVAVWTMELEEVNASRLQIEVIRFLQLGSELKKSVTCVQLASIDFELIQLRHNERWRRFLADHVPPEKLLTLSSVPS